MSEIIQVIEKDGVDVVSSVLVAKELDVQHKNLLDLIDKHLDSIEMSFGRVAFETEPFETNGGIQRRRIAFLTEDQSLFIGALSRNTDQVIKFKATLIKSFQSARKAIIQFAIPQTYAEALQLAATQALQIEHQQKQIEEAKPKLEFYEAVTGSSDTVDLGTVAKVLNFKKIGRTKLFDILRNEKVLMQNNRPFQLYQDKGWFRVIESKYDKPDGSTHINFKTVAYQKGIDGIRKILTDKYS